MKDKKHIDRIFQERLKDFEATPNDAVWERINAELHGGKRKRKVIPIWWKIGGIAAGLLLMLAIGNFFFNTPSNDTNSVPTEVVDTSNDSDSLEDSKNEELDAQDIDASDELLNNNLVPNEKITEVSRDNSEGNQSKNTSRYPIQDASNKGYSGKENAVADSNSNNRNDRPSNEGNNGNIIQNDSETGVVQSDIANNTIDTQEPTKGAVLDAVAGNDILQNLPEQPAPNESLPSGIKESVENPSTENAIAVTEIPQGEDKDKEETKNITEEVSPSIEEAMASSEDGEDYDEKEEVIDRWSVTPNVSPVYYNSLGNGSSIHQQFDNNSKSGQLNMSYGVNASYAISNKLSIRSGVSSVNVGYNTNDVVVYRNLSGQLGGSLPSANNSALRNIDLKEGAQGISVISGTNLAFSQVPQVVSQNLDSSIDQEMSFIEVPVELEYKIADKKLGVSLIGGFSTMILNNNNVYTNVNDQRTLLGEANNINNISYSANLGVGLGVKISEKIDLNFEPSFKYQIKTFNNTSGDFKPYIIGVSSGLKFKF